MTIFRLNETIDPEQFDANNAAIVSKLDEAITALNRFSSVTDSSSGVISVSVTPIIELTRR